MQLELVNGMTVRLGRQDVHDRLERFIRLASPLAAKRLAEINYVDMRLHQWIQRRLERAFRPRRGAAGGRNTRCLRRVNAT